jgi:hypothetical protein
MSKLAKSTEESASERLMIRNSGKGHEEKLPGPSRKFYLQRGISILRIFPRFEKHQDTGNTKYTSGRSMTQVTAKKGVARNLNKSFGGTSSSVKFENITYIPMSM